ncbi:MAG: hypothetical protein V4637_19790 [Pseudomonadota bacterium]
MNAFQLKPTIQRLREAAPYLLVELFLPGGTLLAIVLWLTQHSTAMRSGGAYDLPPSPRAVTERVIDIPVLRHPIGAQAVDGHILVSAA